MGRVACAVHLAEGVAAGGQRHGFFIVHGHAGEGFADVVADDRVRVAVGPSGLT
jgi:hypothetical protein